MARAQSQPEQAVTALARRIAELGTGERTHVFEMSFWSERLLSWAMSHPEFKTQLFRFVDVFPATGDDRDVLTHLREYFDNTGAPRLVELGVEVAEHTGVVGAAVSASVARRNIARMAEQFIVGAGPTDAVDGLHRLWRSGKGFTVDLLGEKTVTEEEADRYAGRVNELLDALIVAAPGWAPDDPLEFDDLGRLARINVSIKPTALASLFAPLSRLEGLDQAKTRLRPILTKAMAAGAFVNFDMEHYDVKDLTLQLFRELLEERAFADLDAGIVVQAYLKDARDDLADLIAWSGGRHRPITVRLVKGAYWDAETIGSRAAGWPVPVFDRKEQTDANYERCTRLLHDHHGSIRAAFGTHNLRSLAHAVSYARDQGIPDSGYEFQMLFGMAEPVQSAMRRLGLRLRIYSPVGELVPGMAYLVRRLLENTSNESFVRARFAEGRALDELVAAPGVSDEDLVAIERGQSAAAAAPSTAPTDAAQPPPYEPEPNAPWRTAGVRAAFGVAIEGADPARRPSAARPPDIAALIGGERVVTGRWIASVDPGRPEITVARSVACSAVEADAAVAAAKVAWPAWAATPARDRAAVCFRAADWMRHHRDRLAALEVFEAGKPWPDADGDVCEAIDFCEYYGREMLRLDHGGPVQSPSGEANRLTYAGKGVGAVISPWNFPLAIPTGMVVGSLVAGNAVILKPAEQTPAISSQLVEALRVAGLPDGVLGFLPGYGEDVGARLVGHPDVAFLVFTGSRSVGLQIIASSARIQPGQRFVRRVVAEMGGKNAIVVDADADLDQAVPAIVASAFGFAGQKCSAASRVIVHEAIADELCARLVGATRKVIVDHPVRPSVVCGPVIDADAYARIGDVVRDAGASGTVLLAREDLPAQGWYIGPTIVGDVDPTSALAKEEIFGPVLAVLRAASFADAVALANDTDYALTAGVFSRSPAHLRQAAAELRAGNVYLNRGITGAVVGRQPFGGYGLSGVGAKAGGPDYLLQFLEARVVSENTLRQGFAPDGPG